LVVYESPEHDNPRALARGLKSKQLQAPREGKSSLVRHNQEGNSRQRLLDSQTWKRPFSCGLDVQHRQRSHGLHWQIIPGSQQHGECETAWSTNPSQRCEGCQWYRGDVLYCCGKKKVDL